MAGRRTDAPRTRLGDRRTRLGVTPGRALGLLRQDPLLPVGLAAGWTAERLMRRTPAGQGGFQDADAQRPHGQRPSSPPTPGLRSSTSTRRAVPSSYCSEAW